MLKFSSIKFIPLGNGPSFFLDFLRAFSAQAVLFGHSFRYMGLFENLRPPQFPYIQNIAVVIFFFLSGFLITYTVVKKNQKQN